VLPLPLFVLIALVISNTHLLFAAPRTWKDATGKFSIQAELVEVRGEEVLLKTTAGRLVSIAIAKLSPSDRQFLNSQRPAQNAPEPDQPATALTLGEAKTVRLKIGMEMTARGNAKDIVGIVTVPMDWPEQKVRVVDQEQTPNVKKIAYRTLNAGAKQMMIHVSALRNGDEARATVTFEVTRSALEGPTATDEFRIPKRIDRDLRHYLQPGPFTESGDRDIIAAKDDALRNAAGDSAWQQVQALHDFTVDNIRYDERDSIKSAAAALREKAGDCQELSELFVAMCRAHGVPARCVWVPRHSYAEFYLEDAAGRGHWFPAESTNKEHFGFLPRTDVILQKGDNFQMPEYREPTHYAQTTIKGTFPTGGGQPEFKEILQVLPAPQDQSGQPMP
jgi:hypothetical protein